MPGRILVCVLVLLVCTSCIPGAPPPQPTPVPPTVTRSVPPTPAPARTATPVALAPTAAPSATVAAPTPSAPRPPAATGAPTPAATAGASLAPPPGTLAGGRSLGDPKSPELGNTGYDVDLYTLRMKLDVTGRRIDASATIDALSALDRLGQVSLDFVGGYAITSVSVDGAPAQWAAEGNKLVVNLPRPVGQGQKFSLKIDYNGNVQPIRSRYAFFAELGLNIRDDGTAFAVSQPDGSRAWFPCNDHPLDKARFRFEVTVDPSLVAAATGVLVEERDTPDGRLSIWEMRQPMAPYLASVFVAPYERLTGRSPSGIPLRHYVYPERRADAERLFGVTGEALEWFAQRLGPYPFEAFGFALVSLRGASLETQSLILLSDRMMTEGTLIHEMAHMWFGDRVSLASWADIWRNEGFATYFTTLWEQRDQGEEGITQSMGQLEDQLAERPSNFPLGDPPPAQLFGPDSYFKGAWVVHMLRREMGHDAFFAALRAYFERYADRAASRAEFEATLREASGRDLTPFFQRWLDTPGLPTLAVAWTTQRINGVHALDIQVCQTAGLGYPFDLEFLVQGDNGAAQTVRVPLSGPAKTTFTIPFAPTTLISDPGERILAKETVEKVDALGGCR